MIDLIKTTLTDALDVQDVWVEDFSKEHASHPEAIKSGGGHYRVFVVGNCFENKNLITRHRLVNQALSEYFKTKIHALVIKAYTPEEYEKRT